MVRTQQVVRPHKVRTIFLRPPTEFFENGESPKLKIWREFLDIENY